MRPLVSGETTCHERTTCPPLLHLSESYTTPLSFSENSAVMRSPLPAATPTPPSPSPTIAGVSTFDPYQSLLSAHVSVEPTGCLQISESAGLVFSVRLPYLEFGGAAGSIFDSSAVFSCPRCGVGLGWISGCSQDELRADRGTRDDRFYASGPMRAEEEAGCNGGRSPIVLRDSAISSAVRFAHPTCHGGILYVD